MIPPPHPCLVCLHGEFDGYGDFFTILAYDVEYIEIPGRITVGDVILHERFAEFAAVSSKWAGFAGVYSGKALACRTADTADWESHAGVFVVVARDFEMRGGRDWPQRG